jgi:hypothetical protein
MFNKYIIYLIIIYIKYNVFYGIVTTINFLLYMMVGLVAMVIPNRIGYGITAMIFTIIYNILFTKLLKLLNHKNKYIRNIIYTIYFLQCNSCLVFLFYANKFIQPV